MMDDGSWKEFETKVTRIVVEGRSVRERIADAVGAAIAGGKSVAHDVTQVIDRTAKAAASGARQATEASRGGVLREVVHGVGDGLSRSALAAKLAVSEGAKRGYRFAREDIDRLAREFGGAGSRVIDSFVDAVANAGDELAGQLEAVREHAQRTRDQIEPGLRSAVDAVRQDPLGLATDTARAGAGAARRATGELFDALGGLLGKAAERLRK